MATNTQLKFYKVQTLPATLVAGAIYFEVTTQRIVVAKTTTEYDAFGVGLKNATLNGGILTIERQDGSKIEADLNDIASASSVQTAINGLQNQINNNKTAAENAQSKADAAAEAAAANAEAIAKEAQDRADAISGVNSAIDAAKSELQGNINLKANAADVYTKTEVDGFVNVKANAADVYNKTEIDSKVEALEGAIAGEAAARGTAIEGLQSQIDDLVEGTVSVEAAADDKYVSVTKADGEAKYTVASKGIDDAISAAVAEETNRATGAEGTIANNLSTLSGRVDTLVGDDADKSVRAIAAEELAAQLIPENAGEALDTLKEIADWIQAHPNDASQMNSAIETNRTNIANNDKAISDLDADYQAFKGTVADTYATNDALGTLDGEVDSIAGDLSALTGVVGGHTTSIGQLQTSLGEVSGKADDNAAAIEQINTDLAGKVAQGDFDELEGIVEGNSSAIGGLNTEVDHLEAATGFTEGYVANASANYISGATSLNDADVKLDAAIKAVADSVADKNVSAEGDTNYITASAANNKVTVSAVTGTVESKSGLATNAGVYEALCWVEFN